VACYFLGTWNSPLSTRSENVSPKRAGSFPPSRYKFITQERKFWLSPQTIALPRMPQFTNYKDVSHGLICGRRRSLIVLHRSLDRDACQHISHLRPAHVIEVSVKKDEKSSKYVQKSDSFDRKKIRIWRWFAKEKKI